MVEKNNIGLMVSGNNVLHFDDSIGMIGEGCGRRWLALGGNNAALFPKKSFLPAGKKCKEGGNE